MTLKKSALTIVAVLGVLAISACSQGDAQSTDGSEPVTVTVGHDLWVGYSGVFLAQELGYFEDAGLDVQLKPFSNPGDTLPAVLSGNLDIGLTTLQNLAVLNGKGDTDLAAIALLDSSNGADAIVANEAISSLEDLEGKTVALTLGEVNHFLFLAGLEQAGVDPSNVKITSMSADDAGAAFVAGKVDAAVTWEPWVTKATQNGGKVIFTSASIPDTIMDSVVVPRGNLNENEATYRKFIEAIDQGVAYLESEPDEAAAIIGTYLDASADDVTGMLAGDKIYGLADNKRLFGSDDAPGPVYQTMKSVVDFALKSELIEEAPLAESLFEARVVR